MFSDSDFGAPGQPLLIEMEWPTLRFVLRRRFGARSLWDLKIEANGTVYSWEMFRPPSINPAHSIGLGACTLRDPVSMASDSARPAVVEEFGWVMPMPASAQAQSIRFEDRFRAGRVELWIEGGVLNGGFVLERLGDRWWMRKMDDEFASATDAVWHERAVEASVN